MTIVGLGNPTERYRNTRHNIGFMVADVLANRLNVRFHRRPNRLVAVGRWSGREVRIMKPMSYMNKSGLPVSMQMDETPDELLVIVDDMSLPFGRLRLRPSGSDGGHNGLASVISWLGRDDFPRVRIGIGAPPTAADGASYVLMPFPSGEARQLPDLLARAAEACLTVVSDGLQTAMNLFNPAPIEEPSA